MATLAARVQLVDLQPVTPEVPGSSRVSIPLWTFISRPSHDASDLTYLDWGCWSLHPTHTRSRRSSSQGSGFLCSSKLVSATLQLDNSAPRRDCLGRSPASPKHNTIQPGGPVGKPVATGTKHPRQPKLCRNRFNNSFPEDAIIFHLAASELPSSRVLRGQARQPTAVD